MTELAYIDESYDTHKFVMTAFIVADHAWRASFEQIQAYRRHLKERHGIFTSKEFHATDFVAGRGRIAPSAIPKALRADIFREYLAMLASLPGVAVINGCWERANRSLGEAHLLAYSRIQERLQRRCQANNTYMVCFVDEGKENEIRKLSRRTKRFNPVGSRYGAWESGEAWKNIPNERLLEDPIFKSSQQSYFLQSADFAAFSLLKSEVPATERVRCYSLDSAFDALEPVLAKEASRQDHRGLGIVRT